MNNIVIFFFIFMVSFANAKLTNEEIKAFIINGENSEAIVPYHVHIEIAKQGESDVRIGGGTLISPFAVLTVAQNVDGFHAWRCGAGALTIDGLQWIAVVSAYVHEDYNPQLLFHNIAILRLNEIFVGLMSPINMAGIGSNLPTPGSVGQISGFGFNSSEENNAVPLVIQIASQTVLTQQECIQAYPHLAIHHVENFHFCAINQIERSNICAGDQGAPFAVKIDEVFGLVGFASTIRTGNCSESYPALFVRLAPYRQWINNHLN